MIMNLIMSFIRSQVDNLLGQATKEIDRLGDEVAGGLRNALNPLQNGMWTGQGAEKFYEEMTSVVFPEIAAIATGGIDFIGAFPGAANIIEQADEAISGIVNSVVDMFDIL
ncbi:MAG: hypothetical protein IPK52_04895 [Chloroflexi bacterium]|nr:hypothetical protein [Chloroflexota bacterium]